MKKLAIDIVLLPSEEMMHKAIAINRYLNQKGNAKIVLNQINCLPHISLLMGCIKENDLPELSHVLNQMASQFPTFHLKIEQASEEGGSTVLDIRKQERLQELHEKLIEKLKLFLSFDATVESLYDPAKVQASSVSYINQFLTHSSFIHFSPHITVGSGTYRGDDFPMRFTAATLAICHLGNHCTCRKILYSVTLQENL